MYKLETGPLTISGVLKNGWDLYKASLLAVLIPSLVIAIIHVLPYFFGYISFFHHHPSGRLYFSWWAVLIFIVLLIVEAYFVAVLFYNMYLKATEQKTNYPRALMQSNQVLINLYIGMIIYYVAVILGVVLFILPAVFIAVLFSMFLPYIIIEKRSFYEAFTESARLVWGHWWQTFCILVIPYALIYLARSFLKFTPWEMHDWALLVDLVMLTFIMPYFYAVIMLQYFNLKIIKSLPQPISERPRTRGVSSS